MRRKVNNPSNISLPINPGQIGASHNEKWPARNERTMNLTIGLKDYPSFTEKKYI